MTGDDGAAEIKAVNVRNKIVINKTEIKTTKLH